MSVFQVEEYYVYIPFVKLGYVLTECAKPALEMYIRDNWGDDFNIDDSAIVVDGFYDEREAEDCEVQLTNLIKGSML